MSATDRRMWGTGTWLPPTGGAVGFTGDGKYLLAEEHEPALISGSSLLRLYTVDLNKTPPGPEVAVNRVFDLPDRATGFVSTGSKVFFVVRDYAKDGGGGITRAEVHGWDLDTAVRLGPFPAVGGRSLAVGLGPVGDRLAVVSAMGTVELTTTDGKQLWRAELPPDLPGAKGLPGVDPRSSTLAFSRDKSVLVVAIPRRPPVALDAKTGRQLPELQDGGLGEYGPFATAVSSDGRLAALSNAPYRPPVNGAVQPGGDPNRPFNHPPRLVVWDTSTGAVVRQWRGQATGLAFHPTRPVLAVLEPNGDQTRLGFWEFPPAE